MFDNFSTLGMKGLVATSESLANDNPTSIY